jgi:dipeptide/tripeptide permease
MELTLGNFYIYINLGGLFATIITPFLRNSNGGESYTLVFAVGVSTFFIASGN